MSKCNTVLTQHLEFKTSCTTDEVIFFLLLKMIQSLFRPFYDSATELTNRLRLSDTLKAEILRDFQDCLYNSNSYIQPFNSAIEVCADGEDLHIVLHAKKVPPKNGHTRTYNLPTGSEIAALLPGDQSGN